jgi:thiamine-phosphate pyrophosphorylase
MAMKLFLARVRLYLVLDAGVQDYPALFEILKEAVEGGVDIVQLRDKDGLAKDILQFSRTILEYLQGRIPFVVNDRIDVAKAAGADGVHLGQDDLPLEIARDILGPEAIIGVSCQTAAQAWEAHRRGADYIGFGSVFKTLTKPNRRPMDLRLLESVVRDLTIPVFAIGGIELENVGQLTKLGVKRVAVTRAICLSSCIRKTAEDFKRQLSSVRTQLKDSQAD